MVVVFRSEEVQVLLQFLDARGLRVLGAEPVLHRLLESLDLALGLRVRGGAVLLHDVALSQFGLEGVAAALASSTGQAHGEDHAVVGQR